MRRHPRRAFAGVAALLVVLAGCGGSGGGGDQGYREPKGPSTATITIDAGNFYFKPNAIDAAPGITTIELASQGGLHTLVFDNGKVPGFQLEVAGSGDSQSLKVDLKPGKYVFYCDIPTHRQQGMEGTITVK